MFCFYGPVLCFSQQTRVCVGLVGLLVTPIFGLPFATALDSLSCCLIAFMSFFVASLSVVRGRAQFPSEFGELVLPRLFIVPNIYCIVVVMVSPFEQNL